MTSMTEHFNKNECIDNISRVLGCELEELPYYDTIIKITKRNADEIIFFSRSRWKIENQGFNNQKTRRYNLEHANSLNYNAIKNHYLITQLADILRQLYESGVDRIRELNKSIKEISSNLLESFRNCTLTKAEDILNTVKRIQMRFS